MPGGGIAAAAQIRRLLPSCVVVMLTVSRDDDDLFQALRAGADGYLLKDIDPERLSHAVRLALTGEAVLPRELARRLVDELRRREPLGAPSRDGMAVGRLTPRERDVLDLMRRGLDTAAMARTLFVSAVTIRTHVSSILRKLDATDRDEAVRLASPSVAEGSPGR
jgi:DNA-binding NarL/FixJ family response regulator